MFQSARAASSLPIFSNGLLIALKLGVGIAIGSISVISDGMDTGIDMFSAFVAFVSIRIASRPPDPAHSYGHGKAENLGGVVESFFIIAGGSFVTYEALHRIFDSSDLRLVEIGIAAMAVSVVVNVLVAWHLARVARRTGSPALSAAAKHRATDVFTSLGVLVGLALVRITGITVLDPILALGVAALIFWAAIQILRSSLSALMDSSLPDADQARVYDIMERYADRVRLDHMHTRKAGRQPHFDLTTTTCQHLTVGTLHQLTESLKREILQLFPEGRVTVHAQPCTGEEKTVCPPTCPVNGSASRASLE